MKPLTLISLIGDTPLIEAVNIARNHGLKARLLLKAEMFNPGGSAKDRPALWMIEDAERRGVLKPGSTIIEPTSGNTGIGLAWIGKVKGYKVVLTMPETMSLERRRLLAAFGAEIVLTPGADGMKGAIAEAERLRGATEGGVILGQFDNQANPMAHEMTTGPEIIEQTRGNVDYFVAGVGTGGTVSGVGRALKKANPSVTVVAVEPASSPVISGGSPGPHKLQGIGAGFIPGNYDPTVVDSVMPVTDEDAFKAARILAAEEGVLAGISSGAALAAAMRIAALEANAGKVVVALLPDTGERYLSTGLFEG